MYKDNVLHVLKFNKNFLGYCIDRDNWEQLKLSRLIITNDVNDRITKHQLADLYYHEYNRQVAVNVARNDNIRVKLKYNKDTKRGSTRGLFVCVRIRPLNIRNQTLNELQNTNPLETQSHTN